METVLLHKTGSFPSLFTGSGNVALNGAVVDLTFSGNILFVNESGELAGNLPSTHLSRRYSLGYRIGATQFKLDYRNHGSRLRQEYEVIVAHDPQAHDHLGISVAMDGPVIIGGAQAVDEPVVSSGAAYAYRFNGYEWRREQKILNPEADGF